MTWTVDHPQHGPDRRYGRRAATRVRVYRPLGVAGLATLTVLIGAWAAVVAFVGPDFGYRATNSAAWQWTTTNWLLHLVPGGVAVAAGLSTMVGARAATVRARVLLRISALATVAAGAWLVIGPASWPVIESTTAYVVAGSAQTSFTNQMGANLGPGLLLVALGCLIFEAVAASRPARVSAEPVVADAGAREPVPGAVAGPEGSPALGR